MEEAKTKLSRAILENNLREFEELICQLENIDSYQQIVNETLMKAVQLGRLEHVNILLEKGANVQHESRANDSLIINTKQRDPAIIKLLLSNGANVNHKGRNGKSDFMFIIENQILTNSDIITLIYSVDNIHERSILTGGSCLHIVSQNPFDDNKIPLLEKIIAKGVSFKGRDNYDDTPLHLAAKVACCDTLKFLIERGADITERNRNGETVLHSLSYATEDSRFSDAFQLLLEHGLDINESDLKGRTLLHKTLAVESVDRKFVQELIRHGLSVNLKDNRGRNEMFYALTDIDFSILDVDIRTDLMKFLALNSVTVDERDSHGLTPLHVAAQLDDLDLLDTLLDLGADISVKSNTGATPLHFSCRHYNMSHVMIITYTRNDKDVNVRDNFGSTPLHWAVWYRNLSTAQTLLQAGANTAIKDNFGDTPSDLANKFEIDDFQNLLETYKTIDSLELKVPTTEHTDKDHISACPKLRYIVSWDDVLDINGYMDHLKLHHINCRKFVDKIVQTRNMGLYFDIEENKSIPEYCRSLMTTIAEKVSSRNQLFKCELRLAGSAFEGTKVKLPDEFDYLWILTEFNDAFTPMESDECPEGFVKLRLISESEESRFEEFIDSNKCLDSDLVLRTFYKLINEEVHETLVYDKMFDKFVCIQQLNEINGSISNLKFEYFGIQVKDLHISIDIVPTVEFRNWIPRGFPVEKLASNEYASNIQYSIVFKTPARLYVNEFTRFFRVSYAYIEQQIFRSLPGHVKKGYIVLKALCDAGYIPKVVHRDFPTTESYITSYILKTCALHVHWHLKRESSEARASREDTKAFQFARDIVHYLEKCIAVGHLPSFFDDKNNLIGFYGFKNVTREPWVFTGLLSLINCIFDMFETSEGEIHGSH